MTAIKPFKGIRPVRDKAHLVASRAVNTYKTKILNAKLEENPFTFLHVILPEFGKKASTKPNSTERFQLVRKKFESYRKKGILFQDLKESFYLYRQIKDGFVYTGLIAGARVDDYANGKIRIHEQTLTKREEVFKNYLDVCGFNAEPVLLSYPENESVNKVIAEYTRQRAEYEFTTSDNVTHYLWIIDKSADVTRIINAFKKIDAVYIADGHHRSASSYLLAQAKRKKIKNYSGEENFNYFMAFFVGDQQLRILDYNRVVKDLNGLSPKKFLEKLADNFEVKEYGAKDLLPRRIHQMTLYMEKKWYLLTLKKGALRSTNPVDHLDAQILTDKILSPLLGIHDLKTDPRIGFVSGPQGLAGLKKPVDEGKMKAAFALYPVSIDQLKEIADTKNIMPPKTTWIEPKLRSGLVIQSLE